MIVLLAAAVSRVPAAGFREIECTPLDADRIYDTLDRVCGDAFDRRRSSVVHNPTAENFLGMVASLSLVLGADDQLVVYFSGHADEREGMARLLFANADEVGRGRTRVDVLAAPLVDSSTRSVLILDCCNAGNALTVADTRDALFPRRIAVIASSGPYLPSTHGQAGSAFTMALCRALDELAESGGKLSLSAISDLVEADADFGKKVHVNHPSGYAEEVIMSDVPSYLRARIKIKYFYGGFAGS